MTPAAVSSLLFQDLACRRRLPPKHVGSIFTARGIFWDSLLSASMMPTQEPRNSRISVFDPNLGFLDRCRIGHSIQRIEAIGPIRSCSIKQRDSFGMSSRRDDNNGILADYPKAAHSFVVVHSASALVAISRQSTLA